MGDPSYLEKMGRELKCPICLSLLNSAASLGCNHVFCNVCIEKSMKSGLNCPVCKVPYRRREVRPAPHMDNLVSIYKSMEAASGVNIFVTQNLSSAKLSDGEKQVEGDGNGSKGLNAETSESTAYVQRTLKKESQKTQKSKRKISASSPLKPSFPRKKRVQVPQHPLSETPTRPAKLASSCNEVNQEPKESTVASEDNKGQPVLSPFFWLRERDEEDEKSNQQSDLDQPTESLTMNVLAFSDIKDSLDESPSKPQMEEVCGKPSYDLDLFDSEMFEWTQRACSPELCSSPFKLQVEDVARTETALLAAAPNEEPGKQNPNGSYNQNSGILDDLVPDVPPPEGNSMKDHTRRAKLTKRGGKKKDVALKKCSKKLAESATGNYSRPATETECLRQEQEHNVIISFGSLKNGSKRSKRKIHYGTESTDAKGTLESVPAAPINLATPNENFTTKTSAFQEGEKENQFLEKRRKNNRASKTMRFDIDASKAISKNVLTDRVILGVPDGGRKNFETETLVLPKGEKACQLPENNCTKGRGRKKAHFCNNNKRILEDISAHPISLGTPNNGPENFGIELSAFQEVEKFSQFPEKNSKNGGVRRDQRVVQCRRKCKKQKLDSVDNNLREKPSINQNQHDDCAIPGLTTTPSAIATSTDLKREHKKQEKVSSVCVKTSEYDNITQEKYDGAQANRSQLSEKLQSTDGKNLDSMTKIDCSEKHERLDDEFHCAFCRSSEESEGSGRMVHYFNGKPIDTDDIKNSKVIHAHWNCVEWAPNVYFDGDTAINLEAELSRSRRIKCGCCGNKGAALGCYEKNCRKSFHVPCAKLMPQCQWDTEKFVMLCPLHPDSKLPSQDIGHQERKSSGASKRQSNTKCTAVAREISNNGRFTFRESSKKLVLCCSALSVAEREAVDEFQRLSGVPVLQKWDDSVTHIIASTDENGACKRTLKILMGILKGKWILGIEWIKACIQAIEQIEEERFEITLDVHGSRDGPQLGRLRVLNNQPKLFAGFKFFFTADFAPSYKGYLQQLVTAAGGIILHRKPVSSNNQNISCSSPNCQVFIIYSLELPDQCNPAEKNNILHRRRSDAELLAKSAAAKVATNLWLLNSIASSKLTSLAE